MAVDASTTISTLDTAKPATSDPKSEGPANFQHIKTVLKTAFPNVAGAVAASDVELSYVDGVTSAIQTQLNARATVAAPSFTGLMKLTATSNSYMTIGLVLDQSANTDEILAFQSGNTSHGMTTLAADNTYASFKKVANSGVVMNGYSQTTVGVKVRGLVVTEDSTRSTAAVAPVMIEGLKKSGTTSAAMSANVNVVVITDGTNARFIFDSDGDSHQDVGTAWTNYDHLDDVATLDALAYNVARKDDPIKRKFGEWMAERRDALTEQNLVKFSDDGHHFVNMSKLTMLHTGAIRQMGEKLDQAMQVIANLQLRLENKNA